MFDIFHFSYYFIILARYLFFEYISLVLFITLYILFHILSFRFIALFPQLQMIPWQKLFHFSFNSNLSPLCFYLYLFLWSGRSSVSRVIESSPVHSTDSFSHLFVWVAGLVECLEWILLEFSLKWSSAVLFSFVYFWISFRGSPRLSDVVL